MGYAQAGVVGWGGKRDPMVIDDGEVAKRMSGRVRRRFEVMRRGLRERKTYMETEGATAANQGTTKGMGGQHAADRQAKSIMRAVLGAGLESSEDMTTGKRGRENDESG